MKKSESFQHIQIPTENSVLVHTATPQAPWEQRPQVQGQPEQMGSCSLSTSQQALNPLHLEEFYDFEKCRREGECSHTKAMLHWPGAWEKQAIPSKPVKDLICPRQKEAWPVSSLFFCCPGIFLAPTLDPRVPTCRKPQKDIRWMYRWRRNHSVWRLMLTVA